MDDCEWCQDEICVNADCPMCCDYCPVPDVDGVCRFEKREREEMAEYFAGGHLRFVNGKWRDDDGNVVEISRVKHGHWTLGTGENALQKGYRMCSQCGEIVKYAYTFYGEHNYCPNCGAKMDDE